MSTPILATKLYIPQPRAKIVLRPRLIERLNQSLATGCKLTLLSASAGFGKTTLVSEWIATCERPAAWLSLDEGDSDPVRFISYLVAALQTINAVIGEGLMIALQSHQPPSTEVILTALLNEISTIPKNFLFILDDYHAIDSQPVDQALAFLVEHQPPQMHLVIATREDPSLPLARLRVRGQLTELRAADLRFTPAEAAEFLNQMMGLNLSEGDIDALEARTEGWIAGLQLAALSMQGREDSVSFIQAFTGSHRYVLDYLVEEVLQQQPELIRNFLLQTSILDRFCTPLCNAVTEREDGKEMLDILEHSNLFIIPLDDQRQWYRYHRLFADVLQTHLMEAQPDRVSALHSRASAWYERNGLRSDAIRHALAAQDFERAADLIELAFPVMNHERRFATLLGWLKALPDKKVRIRPVLCYGYALSSMACGENESVEPRLRDAERWLDTKTDMQEQPESSPVETRPANSQCSSGERSRRMVVADEEEFRRLPGLIALIRGGQALGRGDLSKTEKYARRVLDLASDKDYLMLGGAAAQLGLVAWANGELDTARRMTADGIENLRLGGFISPAIGGAIVLADIHITQGRLHEAMSTYEEGLQWTTEPGTPVLQGAADMYVGMSSLHYEYNDLETATQCLLTSQSLGELAGMPQNPYRWRAAMAHIRQAQGDLDGALQLLEEAERVYDGNFSPNVRPVATRKVRVWLAQGRLGEALRWARERGLTVENELSYLREFDHITLARVLIAQYKTNRVEGDLHAALGLLARLLQAAEEGGRNGSVIEILILQALAYQAQGDQPRALGSLERALTLAEPEGYVRSFVDEGEAMRSLIEKQSRNRDHPLSDYVDKLLAAFPQPIATTPKSKIENLKHLHLAQVQVSEIVEPLSERELEVLKLLRSELSGPEIAQQMIVSLNTLRTHTKNIYNKLGVNNRRAAVRRAEELDLF
jgi:LuxR family maltose regulon positive regulatory protein